MAATLRAGRLPVSRRMALPGPLLRVLEREFPDHDLSSIRIRTGARPLTSYLSPVAFTAITHGDTIWFPDASDCRPDTVEGAALIAHEVAHCIQFRRLGKLGFAAGYVGAYLRNRLRGLGRDAAYRAIPHEVEARAVEARVLARLLADGGVP